MPQVPYQGAPSVAPQDQATPYKSDAAPLDAFGGAVAAATQHLGQVSETAGSEIFARGYAMQELNQQAQATEAVAKFTTDMGQKYADFTSLEGKNAVDAFHPFLDNINSTRDQYKQDLDSPFAQHLYDQETRNQQARFTMSAAGHAGQQNKAYVLGASKSSVDAAGDQVAQMPDNDEAASTALGKVESAVRFQGQVQGKDPAAIDQDVVNAKSDLISKRIQSMAKSQPYAAQKLVDQYSKSGDLLAADSGRLQDFIQKQRWGVASRNEASAVMAGNDTHFGSGIVEPDRAADAIRQIESSGNYQSVHPKTGALGAYQVLPSNLSPWLKQAGMSDMTPQEFLQNKQAQDQLFNYKFDQYQKGYVDDRGVQVGGSFNDAARMWFAGEHSSPATKASDGGNTAPEYIVKANAQLAQNANLKQLTDAGRQRAAELAPGDDVFGDYVTSHIEQLHNQQTAIQKNLEFDNRQTIEGALVTGMQDGKIPTSVADLKTDPKVAAAWDGMQSSDQRKYLNILAHNAKGDVAMTEPRLQTYSNLKGLAITNPDAFLHSDVINADLPMAARKELVSMQAQVFKKQDVAPQTTRALGQLAPLLQASGFDKTDKDAYAEFSGALHDQLSQYQLDNKKSASDEDVQRIGAQLLQKHATPGLFYGTNDVPTYQLPVPDKDRQDILNNPYWQQNGITPDDGMIHRVYVRSQFQKLYGKPAAKPQASASPKVPISD